jgi:two-component system sensor histidine kinase AlgZ
VTQSHTVGTSAGQDFLPDLCQSHSVFMLVLVAELMAVLLAVVATGLRHFSWDVLALISFFVQWVVLLSAILLCHLRPYFRQWSPMRAGAVSYCIILIVTLVLSLIGQWALHVFPGGAINDKKFVIDVWQLLTSLLIAAILAGIVLRYLYLQQQLRNQQQVELNARIQALQSRIRPHFLFNCMNSIASLISTAPETAERVVEDLSELFRASLAEPTLIPISRELSLCRHYLDIEKLRLGDRLHVDWQVDALPPDLEIPSLLLQPLLENAVFHGIEPLPKGGRIVLNIGVKEISPGNKQVVIKISNPVPVAVQQNRHQTGPRRNRMARENIRHRLMAHYGVAGRLSTMIDNNNFTTIIIYPVRMKG